jgi:hypothetical protein
MQGTEFLGKLSERQLIVVLPARVCHASQLALSTETELLVKANRRRVEIGDKRRRLLIPELVEVVTRHQANRFMAVAAQQPCTPHAAKVRRSAAMPAPPLESVPAIVIARGGVTLMARSFLAVTATMATTHQAPGEFDLTRGARSGTREQTIEES